MNLQIIKYQAVKIELESLLQEEENISSNSSEKTMDLSYTTLFPENDKTTFNISFNINLTHPNELKLSAVFVAWFKTSDAIDDTFKKSDFPNINAPAIAYPFLRSLISTITLNAGYVPVMLPSINFVGMHKAKQTT